MNISDEEIIDALHERLEDAEERLANAQAEAAQAEDEINQYQQALTALEGVPGNVLPVTALPVPSITRIRDVYEKTEGAFDKNYILAQLRTRWPKEEFTDKLVSTALGKEAAKGKLRIKRPSESNQPAVYILPKFDNPLFPQDVKH